MEGFNDRVGKVFDCLSSSSSSKAWSLSDAEIERKTWNRDKTKSDIIDDDTVLVSSSFNNLMKSINNQSEKNKKNHNSLDDPPDDDDDEVEEDLDVRSSIGLDPTLDFEDEEDEYDKIATGTEDANAHLLYMKEVNNHAPYLNSHNILSKHDNDDDNDDDDDDDRPLVDEGVKVKSILKRKGNEMEKVSAKRVRFDPACKERDAPEVDGFIGTQVAKSQRSGVPDYLLNPSKYTRYTFNDDDDKRSNTEAYVDFLEQIRSIRKSKDVGSEEEKQPAAELPASVVFVPRKKRGDAAPSNSEGEVVKEMSNGVAAVAVQQDEVSDMIQDDPDVDAVSAEPPKFQKPSRRYRSKLEDDDTV